MSSSTASPNPAGQIPPSVREALESIAFRSLVKHLQSHSDDVANMDLMTVSGFCRNCLGKWVTLAARDVADSLPNSDGDLKRVLNGLSYEDLVGDFVYGMPYSEWKAKYNKKASPEQTAKYESSKGLWAAHDKSRLDARAGSPPPSSGVPLSDVCCQSVDSQRPSSSCFVPSSKSTLLPPPPPPPVLRSPATLQVHVLTVSDRASRGLYERGDQSGPAVLQSVESTLATYCGAVPPAGRFSLSLPHVASIVPDDCDKIKDALSGFISSASSSPSSVVHVVLTTGGTGFSPLDVTPEATSPFLSHRSDSLLYYALDRCAALGQPLAFLSRGLCGIAREANGDGRGVLVINLPGSPGGAADVVREILPLVLHWAKDERERRP